MKLNKQIHIMLAFVMLAIITMYLCVLVKEGACANQGVRVLTTFDKRMVDLEDEVNMSIKIIGAGVNLPRPRLPQFKDFDMLYVGRASKFKFVNGKSEPTLEFKYVLVPQKAGVFPLGPFEIPVAGVVYRTEQIQITVISTTGSHMRTTPYSGAQTSSTGTPQLSNTALPQTQMQPPMPTTIPKGADENLFLVVEADKKTAYPNEQITLTYIIYTRMDLRYEGFAEDPQMVGFWIEDLPGETSPKAENVYIKGRQYAKAVIKKTAIFATHDGEYTLKPGAVKCSVKITQRKPNDPFFDDNFFGSSLFSKREDRVLGLKPLTFMIKPFPEENKPDAFTGVSGEFRLKVALGSTEAKQNEPVIMKITVEGKGNIETLVRPTIGTSDDFTFQDGDSMTDTDKKDGVIKGKKVFDVLWIPLRARKREIPSVTFNYFNLRFQKYMALTNGPFPITVAADTDAGRLSESIALPDDLKKSLHIESHDVRFIKDLLDTHQPVIQRVRIPLIWGNGVMLLGVGMAFLYRRKQKVFEADNALRRRVYAIKSIRRNMKTVRVYEKHYDIRFFEEASRTFDFYIANKFNVSPHGLTFDRIQEKLRSSQVDENLLSQYKKFHETCNMARFAASAIAEEQYARIRIMLESLIMNIEKVVV